MKGVEQWTCRTWIGLKTTLTTWTVNATDKSDRYCKFGPPVRGQATVSLLFFHKFFHTVPASNLMMGARSLHQDIPIYK